MTNAPLELVAVPVEGGSPVEACVVATSDGWRTAWAHDGGRRKEPFGSTYAHASPACAAARYLNERSFGPAG